MKSGKVPERSKGAVLKTVRAKAHAGSNPVLSDTQKIGMLAFCCGALRALVRDVLLDPQQMALLDQIDKLIYQACYKPKPSKPT